MFPLRRLTRASRCPMKSRPLDVCLCTCGGAAGVLTPLLVSRAMTAGVAPLEDVAGAPAAVALTPPAPPGSAPPSGACCVEERLPPDPMCFMPICGALMGIADEGWIPAP